jgi:transposase-like protein
MDEIDAITLRNEREALSFGYPRCPQCDSSRVFINWTMQEEDEYLHDFVCQECGKVFDRA